MCECLVLRSVEEISVIGAPNKKMERIEVSQLDNLVLCPVSLFIPVGQQKGKCLTVLLLCEGYRPDAARVGRNNQQVILQDKGLEIGIDLRALVFLCGDL